MKGGVDIYNWLVKKCRESETFAWCFTAFGVLLMILIAII